jgi:hypothetical protein
MGVQTLFEVQTANATVPDTRNTDGGEQVAGRDAPVLMLTLPIVCATMSIRASI